MTGRVMLEKRIEVPAQIAKRKFTRQSCIDKVVVDGGGKIVVKWSIDQNRIGAVGTNMENP